VFSDTSHGVRCLSTETVPVILTPVCLTDAVRSQGFSPSQRFFPTGTSRLCFAPHPSVGFGPPELFPLSQPSHLSVRLALMSSSSKASTSEPCSD
jgi:hypothetical protein